MKRLVGMLLAIVLGSAEAQPLISRQESELLLSEMGSEPESREISLRLALTEQLTLNGSFSITSKGNGVLTVGGLGIRIFDTHDDGVIFEGALLNVELEDLNSDGCKDLSVSGVATITGEKGEGSANTQIAADFLCNEQARSLVQCNGSPYTVGP